MGNTGTGVATIKAVFPVAILQDHGVSHCTLQADMKQVLFVNIRIGACPDKCLGLVLVST